MTITKLPIASSTTTINIDHAAAETLLAQLTTVPEEARAAMQEEVDTAVETATAAAEAASGAAGLAQSAAELAAATATTKAGDATAAANTATTKAGEALGSASSASASAAVATAAMERAEAAASASNQMHTMHAEDVTDGEWKTLAIDSNVDENPLYFPIDIATKVLRIAVLLEIVTHAGDTFKFVGNYEGKIFLDASGNPYVGYDNGSGLPLWQANLEELNTPIAVSGVSCTVQALVTKINDLGRLHIRAQSGGAGEAVSFRGHLHLQFHPSTTFPI